MKIKLYNDFHGTEVTLSTDRNNRLTRGQMERSRDVLCGCRGCTCGDEFGARGPQEFVVTMDADPQLFDRGCKIATAYRIEY